MTINELSRAELAARGHRGDDALQRVRPGPRTGRPRRDARTRSASAERTTLLLQPTRALPRKNVAGAHRADRGRRRHLLAARTGRGRVRARARAPAGAGPLPGRPRRARGRLLHRRRVRRLRRRPAPLDVGRLRQPLGGVGDPPAPARGGLLPRGGRAGGVRLPLVRRRRPGSAGGVAAQRPTSGVLTHNHRVAADALQPGRPPGAAVPRPRERPRSCRPSMTVR